MTDRRILVSSMKEAIDRARWIFHDDEQVEFVIAEGAATVGGAMVFAQGDLVLHRSEVGKWTLDVESAKEEILASLEEKQ